MGGWNTLERVAGETACTVALPTSLLKQISRMTRDLHPPQQEFRPIDRGTCIGHVHLKVADLPRALDFYCGVLGFELTQRYGSQAAFVSAGGYHHHIGLNTWESAGGSPPQAGATGLYHVAILYPTRSALADALRRLIAADVALDGASDHGVSEALYLRDPDENGIELYWDRPRDQWPRTPEGDVNMYTRPLDLVSLQSEPRFQEAKASHPDAAPME